MDYRRRKQIIIILILVIVLAVIAAGVYFTWFKKQPTCFDRKQNQQEEGIDCGGPCALSCEQLTIKNIETEGVKILALKDNRYDLVAKINNPNPNYGLARLSYSFEAYDGNNQLIWQKSGVDFVLPHENKYLIESNAAIDQTPARAELKIETVDKSQWQKLKDNFVSPDIYVHDRQLNLDYQPGGVQASGIIKNNSVFGFEQVFVTVVLFDKNKEILGVNKTEAQTVSAGEERYFSVFWPVSLPGETSVVEMTAETNVFLDENFMRNWSAPEKFQQY